LDRIKAHIEQLGKEIAQIIRAAFEISYFSRGAWQYEAVLNMTAGEREIAQEFLNKQLERAMKMPHPVF
jgi:hypothetical protein